MEIHINTPLTVQRRVDVGVRARDVGHVVALTAALEPAPLEGFHLSALEQLQHGAVEGLEQEGVVGQRKAEAEAGKKKCKKR